MINVEFFNCGEIRMGSPFDICRINLTGDWVPLDLMRREGWVKVTGHSDDGRYLALAHWETANNEPGFQKTLSSMRVMSHKTIGSIRVEVNPRMVPVSHGHVETFWIKARSSIKALIVEFASGISTSV